MPNLINGTDIVVKFGTEDSEVAVYCSTSCSLNISTSTIPASCKDSDSWEYNSEGTNSWEVTVDGLYQLDTQNGFVDISDLIIVGPNSASVVIGQDVASGDVYWQGMAVCTSATLTAPDGAIATWSATFRGKGPLNKVVVTP